MKNYVILSALFTLVFFEIGYSQNVYVNTNFEKTDSAGKAIVIWKDLTRETTYILDSTNKASGNYSLYFQQKQTPDSSGQTFLMYLPKSYYSGMRIIHVSLQIRENVNTYPVSGFWCKVKKNKKLIGWASTYKGQIAFPMDINENNKSENIPIIRGAWTTYNFTINIKEDPDEVIFGGFSIWRAWFDDIQITINGKKVDDLIIPLNID